MSTLDEGPSRSSAEAARRNFRTQRAVYAVLFLVALAPLIFIEHRGPYLVIWATTLCEFIALSWITKARALGRISKSTARIAAPLTAFALLGLAAVGFSTLR